MDCWGDWEIYSTCDDLPEPPTREDLPEDGDETSISMGDSRWREVGKKFGGTGGNGLAGAGKGFASNGAAEDRFLWTDAWVDAVETD